MFGINKNGTKHKVGIILPAFFPSSRVTYDNTQSGLTSTDVQDAIDELVQSGGGSIDIQRPTFTEASTRANIASGETISTLFGKIKKFFTDLKTVAFTGSYTDLSDKPTIPDISTKVSKSGDTMSGTLNLNAIDNVAADFRTNSNGYNTTISYQTAGNEACVLATRQAITSWIFINGEDSTTYHSNTRWQSLVPGLQIKNNCVAIGKLIANGVTPSYKLDVNGVVRATEFSGGIRDYYNSTPTFFGYSTSGMAQSDATYLAAWDASVSGQYRLRAVQQANLRVAYASSANIANSATSANTARSASYATVAGYIGSGTDYKCTMQVQGTSLSCSLILQSDYNLVLYKNGSAVWQSGTSSRRFKHNIQSMTEERARKILNVRAVTFDWNDGQPVTTQKCDNAGVIAEEVSKVIPDVVVFEQYDNDPNVRIERRVEYERFTPYLIKMVQMQQKQIDTMQATINALEQRLSKLEGK